MESMKSMESMKPQKRESANPFCIFSWGSRPKVEVVKNHRLAVLIKAVLNLVWVFSMSIYMAASIDLLLGLKLWMALGIIALMTPCFLIFWRIISFYRTAYNDDNIVDPAVSDIASKIPSGKVERMSTLA